MAQWRAKATASERVAEKAAASSTRLALELVARFAQAAGDHGPGASAVDMLRESARKEEKRTALHRLNYDATERVSESENIVSHCGKMCFQCGSLGSLSRRRPFKLLQVFRSAVPVLKDRWRWAGASPPGEGAR